VNRTTASPARLLRAMTAARYCGLAACAPKPAECATTWPARWRTWTSAPVRAARSSTGDRSADARLSLRSHAAAEAAAIALVSSARCRAARAETSAAANAAVSLASRATAASATEMNASASRRPSAPLRGAGRRRQSSRGTPSRYPPPKTVWTIRGLPGSSSILRRKFFTCESMVR
jgi:hypothetical protein